MLLAMVGAVIAIGSDSSWARGGRGWGRGRSGVYIGGGNGGFYGGYGRGGYGRGGYYGGSAYYGGFGGGYYGGGYYPNYGYSNGYNYQPYNTYQPYNAGVATYDIPSYSSSPMISNNAVTNSSTLGRGGEVVIENSSGNASPLNYSLNGTVYTMESGQTQRLVNDRQWIVEFDRGDGMGAARYSLSQGRFKFKSTERGWELMRSADQAATRSTAKPPLPDPNLAPELNSLEAAPEPR